MKHSAWRCAALLLAAALAPAGVHAQIDSLLGKGDRGGDLKGLAGMASAPMASGMKAEVTKTACDTVLAQAKSFL